MSLNTSRFNENSMICMRIQCLTSQLYSEVAKDCSPTLKELRERPDQRVKRFSSIFEQKPWSQKLGCNWWLSGCTSTPAKPPRKVKVNHKSRLDEILKAESDHVAKLVHSIETLNNFVINGVGFIPMKLRENDFCLFGELKTIYGLHLIVVLPEITRATTGDGNCVDIVKLLLRLLDDGLLYCYVNHKMLERTTQKIYNECMFGLQMNADSSNFNPFVILHVYHEWIASFCDELMKHPGQNADDIALCMEAEKKLSDLIDVISDAANVSKIVQVAEPPIEAQFKVFSIVKKREEIKSPMLLMMPKKSLRFGYRYPIDIFQLGNFIKSFVFPMISDELGYMNDAMFFVFERCIIYSTVIGFGKSFSYENHFWIKDISFGATADNKMFAELKNCNHQVQVDHPKMLSVLMEQKVKHKNDEITAEIDMSDTELMKLVDGFGDVKKWRRQSMVSLTRNT